MEALGACAFACPGAALRRIKPPIGGLINTQICVLIEPALQAQVIDSVLGRGEIRTMSARQLALFRRRCAIHEAGHAVLAAWAGREVQSCWIIRDGDSYSGRTQWGPVRGLSRRRRQMIATAGSIAELIWERRLEPELPAELFDDPEIMSDTDWQGAECEPGLPDRSCIRAIAMTAELLARPHGLLWLPLIWQARQVIACSEGRWLKKQVPIGCQNPHPAHFVLDRLARSLW